MSISQKRKVLFLDRDGTLIIDCHYLNDPKQIQWLPGAVEFLAKAQSKGYLCFLLTNQSGISRGLVSLDQLAAIHREMEQTLLDAGLRTFDAIVWCPHGPIDKCSCRKPQLGLFEQALRQHQLWPVQQSVDLQASIAVGDKYRDLLPAKTLGVSQLFLLQSPLERRDLEDQRRAQGELGAVLVTKWNEMLPNLL